MYSHHWMLLSLIEIDNIYEIIIMEKARNNVWQYLYMSKIKKLTEGGGEGEEEGGGGGGGGGGRGKWFSIVIQLSF